MHFYNDVLYLDQLNSNLVINLIDCKALLIVIKLSELNLELLRLKYILKHLFKNKHYLLKSKCNSVRFFININVFDISSMIEFELKAILKL